MASNIGRTPGLLMSSLRTCRNTSSTTSALASRCDKKAATAMVICGPRRLVSTSAPRAVVVGQDSPNMRLAQRDIQGPIRAPIVNPADKYESKSESLHRYGTWIMGCMPKFVQQFSVWKDELTIYICPSGVIPVFTFLKCMLIAGAAMVNSHDRPA